MDQTELTRDSGCTLTLPRVCPRLQPESVLVLVLLGSGCKRVRGEPAEARVGAAGVIVDPPRLDDGPGRRQAPEQMLVQALVAQAPVQALDKTVLLRLAGRDVMPLDRTLLLPAQVSTGTEVSAIVGFQNSLAGGFGADR